MTYSNTNQENNNLIDELEMVRGPLRPSGTYSDDNEYSFIVNCKDDCLDKVVESVNSNSTLKLEYKLENIGMLIVKGKAVNMLSLLKARNYDIKLISIFHPDGVEFVNDAKIQFKDDNFTYKLSLPSSGDFPPEPRINRGIVDPILRAKSKEGTVSDNFDSGATLQKATIKSKGKRGADIVVFELYSWTDPNKFVVVDGETIYVKDISTYLNWWTHTDDVGGTYTPEGPPPGGFNDGRKLHMTNVTACCGLKNTGFGVNSNIYTIGADVLVNQNKLSFEQSIVICIDAIVGYHNYKKTQNDLKKIGTLVNCSWGSADGLKTVFDYADQWGGAADLCWYKNGVLNTRTVTSGESGTTKQQTLAILDDLGIGNDGRAITSEEGYYNNSIPNTNGDLSTKPVNVAMKDAAFKGVQFVCSGGNSDSGFYNSKDERSKVFYCRTGQSTARGEKVFPSIRQQPYYELSESEKDTHHKQIICGGFNTDSTPTNGYNKLKPDGNVGTYLDIRAAWENDLWIIASNNVMTTEGGSSFATPMLTGLISLYTKKASRSEVLKVLEDVTYKVDLQYWYSRQDSGSSIYTNLTQNFNAYRIPNKKAKRVKYKLGYNNRSATRNSDDNDNTLLSPPELFAREQKNFNGIDRKRHGNLMRLNNRRGFDD